MCGMWARWMGSIVGQLMGGFSQEGIVVVRLVCT